MGDPLASFFCPKCGAISMGPSLRWVANPEHIVIFCNDCGYSEQRPTADNVNSHAEAAR